MVRVHDLVLKAFILLVKLLFSQGKMLMQCQYHHKIQSCISFLLLTRKIPQKIKLVQGFYLWQTSFH